MLAVATIGLLWLARGPILRGAASALIVDSYEGCGHVVWLVDGHRRLEIATRLYRENPLRTIIMVRPLPGRLVRLGVLPSEDEIGRAELRRHGVPDRALRVLDDGPEPFSRLASWLRAHPREHVILVCARFSSRRQSWALAKALEPGELERVHILAVREVDCDETNWWTSRTGVKEFFNNWLGQLFAWLGCEEDYPEPWDPDEYERELARSIERRQAFVRK